MRILFYTPLNTKCLDIESQANEFFKAGHQIFLLTQSELGVLHQRFSAYGYTVNAHLFSTQYTKWLIVRRWIDLIGYCWTHRIDVLYAHLEPANFIAVLAQYFIRGRVIICRHHVDEAKLYGFDQDLSYRLTYRLAKEIVVVSARAKNYMAQEENVPANRIHQVKLAYDFGLYPPPNNVSIQDIRKKCFAQVVLLTICRLTHYKRPQLSIAVVARLRVLGIDAKLIVLGRGELTQDLLKQVTERKLEDYVMLPGYVNNVQDYLTIADFLVHPSLLESSCISVKEAGLAQLPVVVCKGIGDFDDVIESGINGFIVDPDNFVDETVSIILKHYQEKNRLKEIGGNLYNTVLRQFDIKNTAPYYEINFHRKK